MITIVDYGLGNLGSVVNMFKRIQVKCEITSDSEQILKASKILLPGVGAFDAAMQKISEANLLEVLNQKALKDKVPFLGICLGMQLLTDESEEGKLKGLGYIKGSTKKFVFHEPRFKVPHMGWNVVNMIKKSPLTDGMYQDEQRFYFVHSYYVDCSLTENKIGQCNYGHSFDCIVQNDNIFGAQFHPEKSHKFGMKLFSNFAAI